MKQGPFDYKDAASLLRAGLPVFLPVRVCGNKSICVRGDMCLFGLGGLMGMTLPTVTEDYCRCKIMFLIKNK